MSWMAGCSHTALAAQIPQPSQLLVIRDEDEGPGLRVLTALRAPSRVEDRFDDCFGHWVWRICAYRALAADGLRNAHCARLLPVLIAFLFVSGDWSTTTLGRDVLLYVIRSDRDVEHVES